MWLTSIKREGDGLTGTVAQVDREAILHSIAALRAEGGAIDRPGLGRWALSVPLEDWQRLRAKYPELASRDAQIKSRAWLRFARSEESRPFRLRDRI